MAENQSGQEYRQSLKELLKGEMDHDQRRVFLQSEKLTPEYAKARHALVEERQRIMLQKALQSGDAEKITRDSAPSGNPLLGLKEEDSNSQSERDIIWANNIINQYSELRTSGERGDRKAALRLISHASERFIDTPELIEQSIGIWENVGSEGAQDFLEKVTDTTIKKTKENWSEISPEQLSKLFIQHTDGVLSKGFVEKMLTEYFKGPNSRHKVVDAYYNLASSAIDLLSNLGALKDLYSVLFGPSEILPVNSQFLFNLHSSGMVIDDDRFYQKFQIANSVFNDIRAVYNLGYEDSPKRFEGFFKNNKKLEDILDRDAQRAFKRLGKQEYDRRVEGLDAISSGKHVGIFKDREAGLNAISIWPYNLVLDIREPLRIKANQNVTPLLMGYVSDKKIREEVKDGEDGEIFSYSIPVNDNILMEVFVNQGASDKKGALTQAILKASPLTPEREKEILEEFNSLTTVYSVLLNRGSFDEFKYASFYRARSNSENLHSLAALEVIGFPIFNSEGFDIREYNEALRSKILRDQRRFLNKRGLRVPLDQTSFSRLGYESIVFRRDQDPELIDVEMHVAGNPYKFRLDKTLNLDLQGKTLDSESLKNGISLLTLNALRPIICDENIPTLEGKISKEAEIAILSRMGHLRLLPNGFRFTDQAVLNLFENEGKDLRVVSAQRMVELPTNRVTTYVKPVIEKDDNLDPILIPLDPKVFELPQ